MFGPIRALRDNIHLRACGLFLLAGLFVVSLATVPAQTATAQNTYTVDSNGDADDDNPGDGNCETSGGDCTLRAAIQEANASSNADEIEFDIPQTGNFAVITPTEEFTISEPVTIDGTTSPEYPSSVGGPAIELDGGNLSNTADDGIEVKASDVTIHGLAINSFPDEGIDVFSGNDGVDIQDCFVGIAPDDGTSDRGNLTNSDGNQDAGIDLEGDDFILQDNVISHNNGDGVRIAGSSSSSTAYAQGNLIGLDHAGEASAGNSGAGVRIASGSDVVVGAFTKNIISANTEAGIVVESAGNTIINNYVGTDLNGTTSTGSDGNSLGNGEDGIEVFADGTEIDNNLISGNTLEGTQVGSTSEPADNTTITNNDIGVNASVDATLPNGRDGIDVIEGSGTTIDGNVVGGNDYDGIEISAINSNTSQRTVITGNYVGTNSNGDDIGNRGEGILVEAAPSSSFREVEIFDANVIGHNGDHGIRFDGAEQHDVAGNYIGTNANGDDLGNDGSGIFIYGGQNLDIYTAVLDEGTEEDGNVIGFNDENGIYVFDADNTEIEENYVGTNPNGDDLGNGSNGLRIFAGSGGSADGAVVGYGVGESVPDDPSPSNGENGNAFANNGAHGVIVEGDGNPVDNSIRGNSVYGNADQGIVLDGTNGDDNGDGDAGPNHGQNYPVIDDVTNCDDSSTPTTVDVTYKVRSNDGGGDESQYPLQIDFYVADSESGSEGKTFIQSEEYESSDALSSVGTVLETEDATCDDFFVATATDDRGNTSEFFSPSQQLPVELAAFEGTQTGEDAVELSWTTASEQNNAGFEVQRRDATEADEVTAEGDWEKVGYVESKADGGTTNEAITYRFKTEDLEVGTHSFRLKQVDLDGTENLHDPTVVELRMKEALRLDAPAPNPVRGQTTLSFAVKEQAETTISLYNTLGQKVSTVYRGTPSAGEQQTVDLSATDLSSGVYFLRLEAGGQTRTERMSVVR